MTSERTFRWVLVGVMFMTLFLPNPYESNWFLFLWGFMNSLAVVMDSSYIDDIVIYRLGYILFTLSFPIVIFLNWGLAISASRGLKIFYRAFLLVSYPVMWWAVLNTDPSVRGIGVWTIPIVGTIAALVEIAFIIREQETKPTDSRAVTE
jgi:hypothetical protein